jgi:hypothetical protein
MGAVLSPGCIREALTEPEPNTIYLQGQDKICSEIPKAT